MSTVRTVFAGNITFEFLIPDQRSYPAGCIRVFDGHHGFTMTAKDLNDFADHIVEFSALVTRARYQEVERSDPTVHQDQ